jgi:hypothetical protein
MYSAQANDAVRINHLPNAEAEEAGTSKVTSSTAPNQSTKPPCIHMIRRQSTLQSETTKITKLPSKFSHLGSLKA